jgi:hypothetical protein
MSMSLILSIVAMVLSIWSAYLARKNWMASVYLLAARVGPDTAAAYLCEIGYSQASARKTVAKANAIYLGR